MSADYTCALCGKGGMTEHEAMGHTCGEPDQVPDMAEAPMTTREAVTVLANQMANITVQFNVLNKTMEGFGAVLQRLLLDMQTALHREYPLLYPKPEQEQEDGRPSREG